MIALQEKYEMLDLLDFNNDRKRMSVSQKKVLLLSPMWKMYFIIYLFIFQVIVRVAGQIVLYCKGAGKGVHELLNCIH